MISKELVDQLTDLDGYTETSRVVKASDLRSPLAQARDEWFDSFEGRNCLEVKTIGLSREMEEYLKNRLTRAFEAGTAAMKRVIDDAIAGA